jgi:hypothetical protein
MESKTEGLLCAPFIFFLYFNKELEGVTSEMEPEFFLLLEKALLRDCCSYGHLQYEIMQT